MISSANKSMLSRFREITGKSIITMISAFGSFHKNKLNRIIGQTALHQFKPIYITLIMGDINAMYIITTRHTNTICFQTVTRFPTISIRTYKEIIKCPGKDSNNKDSKYIAQPGGHSSTGCFFCF